VRLEVIEHLDDVFEAPDYPAEIHAERVSLVEVNDAYLVIILRRTAGEDGLPDYEYIAFDSIDEAYEQLDSMGYDILK
jgi:hypothetical protein